MTSMTRRASVVEVKLKWGLGGIPLLTKVIMTRHDAVGSFSGLVVESFTPIRKTGFCACGRTRNATFVGDFGELLGQLVVRDFSEFSSVS